MRKIITTVTAGSEASPAPVFANVPQAILLINGHPRLE